MKPREARTDELIQALHKLGRLDAFEFAEHEWGSDPRALVDARACGNELVSHKLARWLDSEHTVLELTAFGRFWMSEGGYFAFLRSNDARPSGGSRGSGDNGGAGMDPALRQEYDRVRFELMRRRLKTFWWGFGFSVLSLAFSIVSLYLALSGRR